jgi:hypothetical protein
VESRTRLTVGFDYRDQFPWLDIAFEGDTQFVRKRNYVWTILINLIDAVVEAERAGAPIPATFSRLV